jgi:hypothetical protein
MGCGANGMRIVTLDDGVVWIFSGVDHCDGMYSSIHAAKIGELLRNSQANLPALLGPFGSVAADAGRGLSLRMDMDRNTSRTTFATRSGSGAQRRATRSSPSRGSMVSPNGSTDQ